MYESIRVIFIGIAEEFDSVNLARLSFVPVRPANGAKSPTGNCSTTKS